MNRDLQTLVETYLSQPTERNKDALVRAGIPLVHSIINRVNVPRHLLTSTEDLENVGLLGLLEALEAYNPDRGAPFASYAWGRIRGAVVDYLREIDVLSRTRRQQVAEIGHAVEQLGQELGDEPEDRDIARYLDITVEKYRQLLQDVQFRHAQSLDAPVGTENDQTLLELVADEEAEDAYETAAQHSLVDRLQFLIEQLPERQQQILALYYYEELTLSEIGQILGVTGARISQILSKTRQQLRERLGSPYPMAA